MKKGGLFWILVATLAVVVGVVLFPRDDRHAAAPVPAGGDDLGGDKPVAAMHKRSGAGGGVRQTADDPGERRSPEDTVDVKVEAAGEDDGGAQLSEEEKREREEEKLVDAFDGLTDKWMEPVKGGVAMEDVDAFAAQFRKVPNARKEECLQRALNLVPDENVMLLAGILMDKSQDRELVELVYNDLLNRDEDVKQPILQQIFKDREHPCWADTAWILDVTGDIPGKK